MTICHRGSFKHISNLKIKVFQKAIPELSKYSLVNIQL